MSGTLTILKNIKKHRKNIEQFEETIKSFIKEFEMNINFNIHNNIYDSFITIYQYENIKNGNIFKYLRHFYYYDPSMDEEEIIDEEYDEEKDENDIDYIDEDGQSLEEENKKESKKNQIRIEITPIFKNKNKNKKNNNTKENLSKDSDESKKDKKLKNKKNKNKNTKNDNEDKLEENKKIKKSIFNKLKVPLLKDIERKITKPKKYIDFNHDVTLYYYIANDKNEFVEEYGYENGKLKYYEGNDLEESLDDTFMQHCDDLHQIEKLPIFLTKDYFDHEFTLFNMFKIEQKKEKIGLGDFFKKLWIENSNISIFDSYLNYILNRFLLLDKFIKMNKKEEEDDDINNIIQKKISKELDINQDFLYYIGKLDLDYGIINRAKYSSFHEIGVFLKIIFIFLTFLDRTTCLTDEEEKEEEFYNELRFYDIQESERGEFIEVFENLSNTFESFFDIDDSDDNELDFNNIKNLKIVPFEKIENIDKDNLQNNSDDSVNSQSINTQILPKHIQLFFEKDYEHILFGIRIKLWNEYMTEYINKMYYDKSSNKKSSFINCYDEFINDIKILIQHKYDNKILENILMKWEEYKDIHTLYQTIVGNIIRIY